MTLIFFSVKAEMLNFAFVVIETFVGTFPSQNLVMKSNFLFENKKKEFQASKTNSKSQKFLKKLLFPRMKSLTSQLSLEKNYPFSFLRSNFTFICFLAAKKLKVQQVWVRVCVICFRRFPEILCVQLIWSKSTCFPILQFTLKLFFVFRFHELRSTTAAQVF